MSNIGLAINPPAVSCSDPDCPFHGTLRVRGRLLKGRVANARAQKMIVMEREYLWFVKKYRRYERRRSRVNAHSPPCIPVKEGDPITIAECRPLSKTVSFVVVGKEVA